jgi:ribosomal-protein-alanine N-acetyltransferase
MLCQTPNQKQIIKMNLNPIIIETKRLKLTGFSPEDMSFIFENKSKNEIKKILGHRTEEDYLKEEYKYQNGYAAYNRSFLLFLLSEKTSNTIIGRCGLHNWNKEHNRAEIGYNMLDENFKKQGFMTEAVRAIIDYGFNTLKLHRLEALVGSNNTPSLKIIENNHFIKEGLLRQHFYVADKYEDSVVFSLLRNEYIYKKDDKTTNY